MYIHTYVVTCIYTVQLHTYMYIHTYVVTCIYTVQLHTYMYIHTYVVIYIYTVQLHTYMYIHTYVVTYIYTVQLHTYMYIQCSLLCLYIVDKLYVLQVLYPKDDYMLQKKNIKLINHDSMIYIHVYIIIQESTMKNSSCCGLLIYTCI